MSKYNDIKRRFYFQWHITVDCNNNCKHCYITESDRKKETLCIEDAIKIVDDFVQFCSEYNLRKRLLLTGGDPILSPFFWDLLQYINSKDREVEINIAGNPELINENVISKLAKYGVRCYQISIDGLKETHDKFRYSGSYEESIKKIKLLSKSEVRPVSLTTVSSVNIDEVPNILKAVFDAGVTQWDFSRFVLTPENENIAPISPEKYRDFLFHMKKLYADAGLTLDQVARKDPLWAIIETEEIESNPEKCFMGGCGIGTGCFDILQDGTVLACRRHLGSYIGKVPDNTFEEIFFNSSDINFLRDVEKIKKCNECKLLWHCRGCRAVAYGATGDYFAPDPQCWL